MSDLDIAEAPALRLSLSGDDGLPLVARVSSVEPDTVDDVTFSELVVPTEGAVRVQVAPGDYVITLMLPSGRMIRETRRVTVGTEDVVFDARGALSSDVRRGERFSLQGALSEAPGRLAEIIAARAAASDEVGEPRVAVETWRPKAVRRSEFGASTTKSLATRRAGVRSRSAAATLAIVEDASLAGEGAWKTLAAMPVGRSAAGALAEPTAANERLLWTIAATGEDGSRRWARIEADAGVEYVALPIPWRYGAPSEVAVTADRSASGRAMSDLAIRDDAFATLMAYLERGRLSLVGPILRQLEEDGTIERAVSGVAPAPLAACAAAYARLATFTLDDAARWRPWMDALFRRHPDVPDCGVVLARLLSLIPGVDATQAAVEPIEAAYRAGVPFFSTGLLTMRHMLLAGPRRDPGRGRMLDAVAPVAGRCDPARLFTVLRYPRA